MSKLIKKYQFGNLITDQKALTSMYRWGHNANVRNQLKKLDTSDLSEEDAKNILSRASNKYPQPIPEPFNLESKAVLKNDVIGRREQMYDFDRKTLLSTASPSQEDVDAAKKVVDNLTYSIYPDNIIEKVIEEVPRGMVFDDKNIILSEGLDKNIKLSTLEHEGTHKLRSTNLVPLTPLQQSFLDDAYGSEFKEAQYPYYGEDYDYYDEEMETTNLEGRTNHLRDKHPELVGKGPTALWNAILNASPEEILEYTRDHTNGYGQNYIDYLIEKYKDDPEKLSEVMKEKAEQIRRAWLYVENTQQRENNNKSLYT